ncbi:MAG: transcriptional repressor LexA [Planctomycetes bacterium]|nr:transcriptional repressor LexA [Planctomycetota bacterium]
MATGRALTGRQREIFEYIRDKIENRGYPPSIREIGESFAIKSPNGVMCHLRALEKKGLIKRQENHARAIQIDGVRTGGATLPLLGLVAAGTAIEAVAQEDRVDLSEMFGGKDHFALRVRGKSMIEDHIDDGDIVVIRKQEDAENGERVVAMVEREVTLKRFFRKKENIRLEPANSTMTPIVIEPGKDIQILGVLVGVLRKC